MPKWFAYFSGLIVILFLVLLGVYWWWHSFRFIVGSNNSTGVNVVSTGNLRSLLNQLGFYDSANSLLTISFSNNFPDRKNLKIYQSLRGDARQELAFACNWEKAGKIWHINFFFNSTEYKSYLSKEEQDKQLNFYSAYCLYEATMEGIPSRPEFSVWDTRLRELYLNTDKPAYFLGFNSD